MKCLFCDAEIPEGATACPNCNAAVETSDEIYENDFVEQKNAGKGMGIASMIVGILAVLPILTGVLGCCCCGAYGGFGLIVSCVVALVLSIVALVLSGIAKKKSKASGHKNTFALIATICGWVALAVSLLVLAVVIVLIAIYGVAIFAEIAAMMGLAGLEGMN